MKNRKKELPVIEKCPSCKVIWTEDEQDANTCFSCGYPNDITSENDDDIEDYLPDNEY
jgi:Zn ribbon nucleic-acid-binding protein